MLQEKLNRSLHVLRVIERALHDPAPWTLRAGGVEAPVAIEYTDSGVIFTGVIAFVEGATVELVHGEDVVACKSTLDADRFGPLMRVSWVWSIGESVIAA